MNGLTYVAPSKNNIFEERYRQYVQVLKTVTILLETMGYTVRNVGYLSSDPSYPTYSYVIEAVHKDKLENGEEKVVTVNIPIPDRSISFIISGIRWIPVFQIADLPIFKKSMRSSISTDDTEVVLQNTYGLLILLENLSMYKVNKKYWPVFSLMVEIEESYETVLEKLGLQYTFESTKLKNGINIPVCAETYLNIQTENAKLLQFFYPFITDSPQLKKYEEKLSEYSTVEETYGNILDAWEVENKNKNVVKATSIVDHIMVPNGLFDNPFRAIDIVYYVLTSDHSLEQRDINDVSMRRVRLGEWLLYKLAQQHKKNVLDDTNNVFSNAILDVLATDQRRILDDSVNPLGELCIMSRIIYSGLGGIAKESSNPSLRNLHDNYYGVIDPIDTPTGDAIGISQHIVPETILQCGKLTNVLEVQNGL